MRARGARLDAALVLAVLAVCVAICLPALFAPLTFGDIETQNLPARAFFADGLRHGLLRWWANELGGGMPLYAEGQAGAAYPGNALFLLARPWQAYNWTCLLHLAWAGLGVAALLRGLGTRRAAAFCGAAAYLLSGPVFFRLQHLNILQALAWLPWVFVGVERGLAGRRGGFVVAGLALAMEYLAGHPQPFAMTCLVLPVYVQVRGAMVTRPGWRAGLSVLSVYIGFGLLLAAVVAVPWAWWLTLPGVIGGLLWLRYLGTEPGAGAFSRGLAGTVGALALAVVLSAGQWLPLAELVQHSVRAAGLSANETLQFSLEPRGLASALLPQAYGSPARMDVGQALRYGVAAQWEWVAHVGVVVLLAGLLAPLLGRRRERWLFWGLGLAALLLAMGRTFAFYGWLMHLPGWHSVRGPGRMTAVYAFAMAVTAGLVIDDLARRGLPRRRWLAALAVLALFALVVVGLAAQLAQTPPGVMDAAVRGLFVRAWLRAALLAVAAAVLLLSRRADRPVSPAWALAACLLVVFDVGTGSAGYYATDRPNAYAPPPDTKWARSVNGSRILAEAYTPNGFGANRHLLYRGVWNQSAYTPLKLLRQARIEALLHRPMEPDDVVARRWLALLRVTYADPGLFEARPAAPERLVRTGVRVFPRAWVTPRWVRVETPDDAFAVVQDPHWRPEAYSVVETPATEAPRRGERSDVLWSEFSRHRITCRVTGDSPRVLVLSQAWYPGWQVRVSDAWEPAEPVDYFLCGKQLPPGIQRVDFVYRPMSIRLGLFVSLLGLAFLAGWAASGRRGR